MPLFDPNEAKEVFSSAYWQDGQTRKIVIVGKEMKPQKSDPMKRNAHLIVQDISEVRQHSFLDFNFLNALHPLNDKIELCKTVLAVTPTKIGTREWNSKQFDVLEYSIVLTDDIAPPITVPKKEVPVSEIDF